MSTPKCPVCAQPTLQRHCPPTNPTCSWDACVNAECKANTDRVTGRHSHPFTATCATCGPVARSPKRR